MRSARFPHIDLFPVAPRCKAFGVGAALGLLNGVLLVASLRVPILAGLMLVGLLAGLWWLTPRTRDTWSIHLFAMSHTFVSGAVCAIRWWPPPVSPARGLFSKLFLVLTLIFLAYCALFIVCLGLVLLLSLLRRRRILQDGTLCPNCLYSLRGNRTGRCPECGHPFTPADLGLTDWPEA